MDSFRAFVGAFWPWSRQQAETHITQAPVAASRLPVKPQPIRTNETFTPPNALGSLYTYRFEMIYKITGDVDEYERELETQEQQRLDVQSQLDSGINRIFRLKADLRADFTEEIDMAQEEIQELETQKEFDTGDIVLSRYKIRSHKDTLSNLWADVYKNGQAYLNRCLEVNFDEPWCLDHVMCFRIRALMDKSRLIQQRRSELRKLQNERFPLRHTPGGKRESLDERIAELKDTLEMADKLQDEQQRETALAFKEFLFQNGVIDEAEHERHSAPQYAAQGTQTERPPKDSQDAWSEHDLDDDGDEDDDEDIDEDVDSEKETVDNQAIAEYHEASNNHESLQFKAYEKEKALLSDQMLHLIAFPKSSIDRFRRLVAKWTASETKAAQEAEAKWMQARDRLVELGLEIPHSPEPLTRPPTCRGSPVDADLDDETRQRRKFRKLNDHRAKTVHSANPSKAATPPRSRDLGGIRDLERVRSLSVSPREASKKKRKLEEYEQRQVEEEWKTPSLE